MFVDVHRYMGTNSMLPDGSSAVFTSKQSGAGVDWLHVYAKIGYARRVYVMRLLVASLALSQRYQKS